MHDVGRRPQQDGAQLEDRCGADVPAPRDALDVEHVAALEQCAHGRRSEGDALAQFDQAAQSRNTCPCPPRQLRSESTIRMRKGRGVALMRAIASSHMAANRRAIGTGE
jgi:hypothetical protein